MLSEDEGINGHFGGHVDSLQRLLEMMAGGVDLVDERAVLHCANGYLTVMSGQHRDDAVELSLSPSNRIAHFTSHATFPRSPNQSETGANAKLEQPCRVGKAFAARASLVGINQGERH